MIHCFELFQLDHESLDSEGLQNAFRKSFDSERDFIVRFTNHFIHTGDKNNSAEAGMQNRR